MMVELPAGKGQRLVKALLQAAVGAPKVRLLLRARRKPRKCQDTVLLLLPCHRHRCYCRASP